MADDKKQANFWFRPGGLTLLLRRVLAFTILVPSYYVVFPRRYRRYKEVLKLPPLSPTSYWDLDSAFDNHTRTRNSYESLARLLGESVALSYFVPPGYYHKPSSINATLRGLMANKQNWQRVYALEVLADAGFAAVIFHERVTKRIVIAYRGSCRDSGDARCLQDFCASWYLDGGWRIVDAPDLKSLYGAIYCWVTFGSEQLDYLSPAIDLARNVSEQFPDNAILLTGHSLGALLAVVAAAKTGLQAITFALPRIDYAASSAKADLSSHGDSSQYWSIYHDADPVFLSAREAGSEALVGVGTCVYQDARKPTKCASCLERNAAATCSSECLSSHLFKSYLELLGLRDSGGKPALPVCRRAEDVQHGLESDDNTSFQGSSGDL